MTSIPNMTIPDIGLDLQIVAIRKSASSSHRLKPKIPEHRGHRQAGNLVRTRFDVAESHQAARWARGRFHGTLLENRIRTVGSRPGHMARFAAHFTGFHLYISPATQ